MPRPGLGLTLPEAGEDGLDHGVELQALLDVQLRSKAGLGVDDPVGSQVEGALGDPPQLLRRLHDSDGVTEGLEVALEASGVCAVAEPPPQSLGIGRRQVGVAASCARSMIVCGLTPPSR